jgi:hypothetical protein
MFSAAARPLADLPGRLIANVLQLLPGTADLPEELNDLFGKCWTMFSPQAAIDFVTHLVSPSSVPTSRICSPLAFQANEMLDGWHK